MVSKKQSHLNMLNIIEVKTGEQLDEIQKLFREYESWLGFDLQFQDFEKEVAALPGKYAPPRGTILMALFDENIAGCVALRPLNESICELKRFFVQEQFQGKGIGKKLAELIVERAREIGYTKMRLDTHNSFQTAIGIYKKLGFTETLPYYHNPMPDVSYWELIL